MAMGMGKWNSDFDLKCKHSKSFDEDFLLRVKVQV